MSATRMVAPRLLTAACVVTLAACTGETGNGRNGQLADGGTYTTAIDSDPGNLHPLQAVQITTNNVISFAYDNLININTDGEIVPQLAEDWEVSPDRVTFTVREGVTCEDGTELTAEHVAANFEWIKDPENASSYLGSGLPDSEYTVEADNDSRTVTLTLAAPYGFLLPGAGLVPIVCPAGLADPELLAQDTDGTGPFVLTDYVADDHLTMQVREDYRWGPDGVGSDEPGFPDEVVFRVVQNSTTAVNLFLSGELSDVSPGGPDEARLEGQDFFTLESESGPLELFFNQREGFATDDLAVRRALTMGLDLDALTQVLTEGDGTRGTSLTVLRPLPCVSDSSAAIPDFDSAAAAQLLDQAGWVEAADGIRAKDGQRLTLTVAYPTGEDATTAGMELVSQLWTDIGVDVQLQGQANNAFLETLFGGTDWDVAFLSVQLAYPTEFRSFGSGPPPPDGQNFANLDNADYLRLSEAAAGTPGQEGCEIWAEAEQALVNNLDVVPIANTVGRTYADGVEFTEGIRSLVEPTSLRLVGG